jgi:RNA polymerase sigma-70 factor (ECF subfamily)
LPGLQDLSDAKLVEAYKQGREDAFALLVGRYRMELFHFLARFLGDRAAADDVFQETFLQVHLSIETFDTERRFKPWLFTIAANKARDYLRRRMQRSAAPLSAPVGGGGDGDREFLDLLQGPGEMPTAEMENRETRELVRDVVTSLPDHLREILVLAYFHQFPYKEIAEMLEIPLGTVKSRLHSAVGTFADLWKRRHGSTPPVFAE